MRFARRCAAALAAVASIAPVTAVSLDATDPSSIKAAAKTVASKMVEFYPGDQPGGIPGLLGDPYYWWEAGGMFGTLIDYWYFTGDSQFNDIVTQALVFQLSPTYDYMPPNQTKSEGNDDQAFWAFAVMTAAEYKYPNPPAGTPAWITIAQAVWNSQVRRWDNDTCNGGLRWQIFQFNNGYNYKNSPSNAGFVNLAARLYAYTGNETYSHWVNKAWDWMSGVQLVDTNWDVFDGTDALQNCSSLNHIQWTYNAGMLLNSAAVMYNMTNGTEQETWSERANGLWKRSAAIFFKNQVMFEVACEPSGNCNTDQQSFKAYFSRYLTASYKWMPSLEPLVQPYLIASAQAAAKQCSGGADGETCGTRWTTGSYDGTYGVGQQMCALSAIQGLLIDSVANPVTNVRGGISHGNASLGTEGDAPGGTPVEFRAITTGDRAGAGILTVIVLGAWLAGGYWIVS